MFSRSDIFALGGKVLCSYKILSQDLVLVKKRGTLEQML